MSIVSHNYNAHLEQEGQTPYVEGIDGPAMSVSQASKARSTSSFASVASSNSVKHYLSSELKAVADQYLSNVKFESTHELAKKLCAGMNGIYMKHKEILPELIEKKQNNQKPKNLNRTHLYNDLYDKVKIPENFELFYSHWLAEEVFGLIE